MVIDILEPQQEDRKWYPFLFLDGQGQNSEKVQEAVNYTSIPKGPRDIYEVFFNTLQREINY